MKPPNVCIASVIDPGEQVRVAFRATRPLPRLPVQVGYWVASFAIFMVGRDVGWVSMGMIGLVVSCGVLVGVTERLSRVYAVGFVADDVVAVRVSRYWSDRVHLVGRWSREAAAPELHGSKFLRLEIAGNSYWLEGDNIMRARMAVGTKDASRDGADSLTGTSPDGVR